MKNFKLKLFIIIVLLLSFSISLFADNGEGEAKQVIQELVDRFIAYDKNNPETAKKIDEILNLNYLLKRCLTRYWDRKMTNAQKEEIQAIFSDVVESVGFEIIRDYYKNNEYRFTGKGKEGKYYLVDMEVDYKHSDGRIDTEKLTFKLFKNPAGNLIIHDIILLEESLVVEYANQFASIINSDGVDGLIDIMYSKLD